MNVSESFSHFIALHIPEENCQAEVALRLRCLYSSGSHELVWKITILQAPANTVTDAVVMLCFGQYVCFSTLIVIFTLRRSLSRGLKNGRQRETLEPLCDVIYVFVSFPGWTVTAWHDTTIESANRNWETNSPVTLNRWRSETGINGIVKHQ